MRFDTNVTQSETAYSDYVRFHALSYVTTLYKLPYVSER